MYTIQKQNNDYKLKGVCVIAYLHPFMERMVMEVKQTKLKISAFYFVSYRQLIHKLFISKLYFLLVVKLNQRVTCPTGVYTLGYVETVSRALINFKFWRTVHEFEMSRVEHVSLGQQFSMKRKTCY